METLAPPLSGINDLVQAIEKTNQFLLEKVQQQVNSSLTLRNWMIGYYIIEYEQHGNDRAKYGQSLFENLAKRLKASNANSLRKRHLYSCKKALPDLSSNLAVTDCQIAFSWFSGSYNFADTVRKFPRKPDRTKFH